MKSAASARKHYMRDVYSRWWATAREQVYGFAKYDKELCRVVCEVVPRGQKLLEVAIGTGYPIADFLQKGGYEVHGIDIAPTLIEQCNALNPDIKCKVGDAEAIEYPDGFFDATYCFHSTPYFPHLAQAISEMLRVTRPGGVVLFDIQNRNNPKISAAYAKRLSELSPIKRLVRLGKNTAKKVLRRGVPETVVVYEVPTYPESIYDQLKGSHDFQVMGKLADDSLEPARGKGSLPEYSRLVFVVRR